MKIIQTNTIRLEDSKLYGGWLIGKHVAYYKNWNSTRFVLFKDDNSESYSLIKFYILKEDLGTEFFKALVFNSNDSLLGCFESLANHFLK